MHLKHLPILLISLTLGCAHSASSSPEPASNPAEAPKAVTAPAEATPAQAPISPARQLLALGQIPQIPPADAIPAQWQGPDHRAFDFWIGVWDVYTPDGKKAGTNRIAPILGGCAILESWEAQGGGYQGHSINTFERASGQWRQLWTDTGALVLDIRGGLEGERMVMVGEIKGKEGKVITNRITWTPLPEGHVRQHWEGKVGDDPWATYFDGRYVPAGESWSPQ